MNILLFFEAKHIHRFCNPHLNYRYIQESFDLLSNYVLELCRRGLVHDTTRMRELIKVTIQSHWTRYRGLEFVNHPDNGDLQERVIETILELVEVLEHCYFNELMGVINELSHCYGVNRLYMSRLTRFSIIVVADCTLLLPPTNR